MNNIFKKDKVIILDDKYSLLPDGVSNGVILQLNGSRERKKKNSEETEEYIYTQNQYFSRINQALNKYVEITQNDFSDLKDLIERTSKIYQTIEELNITFNQYS